MIFAPYWVDAHPDHVAATELIEAARFWSKLTKTDLPGEPFHPPRIFYYFCVHLRLIAQPAFVIDIAAYWQRKRAAIECYHSQFIEGARASRRRSSIACAIRPPSGAGRSASTTPNRSPVASRWACRACGTSCSGSHGGMIYGCRDVAPTHTPATARTFPHAPVLAGSRPCLCCR